MKDNILKPIVVFASLSICVTVNAQEVAWFEAEGNTFYTGSSFVPNTTIMFYSERGGGHLMKEVLTDASGSFRLRADEKFKPAFALNDKKRNGNGMVRFYEEREFSLQQVSIKNRNSKAQITWEADVDPKADISFEVLKSENGIDYKTAETIPASKGRKAYATESDASAFYKINVVNNTKGVRYTTGVLSIESDNVKVYPTAATNSVNVLLSELPANTTYKIINKQGQVVVSGIFGKRLNILSIEKLAAGNYFVVVQIGVKKSVSQFVKL